MPQKHVPVRTCVVCGQERPKRELLRIVRTPAGAVEVDPRGKQAGRGAYLCRDEKCWDRGLKKERLEYVLRGSVTTQDVERLRTQGLQYVREALAEEVV